MQKGVLAPSRLKERWNNALQWETRSPKERFFNTLFSIVFFLPCFSASRTSHRCIWCQSQRARRGKGERRVLALLISDIHAGYFVSYFEASYGPFSWLKGESAIAIAVCVSPFFFLHFFILSNRPIARKARNGTTTLRKRTKDKCEWLDFTRPSLSFFFRRAREICK